METKTLAPFQGERKFIKAENEIPLEIEVPTGEWHYFLNQEASEKHHYIFHLRHSGSKLKISGIVNARGESAPILKTEVIHHTRNTQAQTTIRTLAYDSSTPRYYGVIHMESPAQDSESYLNHHSLLLGAHSKSWSEPSLEIEANQVKCSHAATIRTITDLDLFYLRSRGLKPDQSRELLIEAFLSDVKPGKI